MANVRFRGGKRSRGYTEHRHNRDPKPVKEIEFYGTRLESFYDGMLSSIERVFEASPGITQMNPRHAVLFRQLADSYHQLSAVRRNQLRSIVRKGV